jgi:hypothetical protein
MTAWKKYAWEYKNEGGKIRRLQPDNLACRKPDGGKKGLAP